MEKDYKFIIKIILLFLIGILMPAAVASLTSVIKNPFIENLEVSNDWIGFYGSYMGSILGGLITLVVMDKTIESGDRNLKTSIDENKKINKEIETVRFCNEIAYLIGEYCSDISVYYYDCIRADHYDRERADLHRRLYRNEITSEEYSNMLSVLESNRPRANRSKSTAIYFKLEILLKEEELAKSLMKTLKKVHNTYYYVNSRADSEGNEFEKEIENLLEETRKFIKEYKSNT